MSLRRQKLMVRLAKNGRSKNLYSRREPIYNKMPKQLSKERPDFIRTLLKCLLSISTWMIHYSRSILRSTQASQSLSLWKICSQWRICFRPPLSMYNWPSWLCCQPSSSFISCSRTWGNYRKQKKSQGHNNTRTGCQTSLSLLFLKIFGDRVRAVKIYWRLHITLMMTIMMMTMMRRMRWVSEDAARLTWARWSFNSKICSIFKRDETGKVAWILDLKCLYFNQKSKNN